MLSYLAYAISNLELFLYLDEILGEGLKQDDSRQKAIINSVLVHMGLLKVIISFSRIMHDLSIQVKLLSKSNGGGSMESC